MKCEKEKIRNILVVAITRMGDMLQASPTLVGFKKQYPDAKVTVVIEKQFASICEGIPGIDEIYELDLAMVCRCLAREREGIVDGFKYLSDVIDDLKSRQFDFCLNMSSSGYTALLLKMLEIPDCRGWVSDDEGHRIISSPWAMLFSAFVYHSNRDYNSINLVDIFRCSAGVHRHPESLVFNTSADAKVFAEQFVQDSFGKSKGSGPLICIQAGASQPKRQWSPARFAHLSRLLIDQLDARLVFTGSKSELPIIEAIAGQIDRPNFTIAAGQTNVAQLAGLLEKADVLVTGDTGPMHLSVAVGTPVVALFLASALCFETGPYSAGNIVIQPQISCNPCNPNFPCSRPDCHDQITPELVAYLTKLRLSQREVGLDDIVVPASVADPKDTAVFITRFDKDRFLEFKQVNGVSPRHGRPGEYFDSAREAYRELWKTEFLPPDEVNPLTLPAVSAELTYGAKQLAEAVFAGIEQTNVLAERGKQLVTELLRVINDVSQPAHRLSELGQAIEMLDKSIEEVGLGNPILGALSRIFVMEKENMRGDDPAHLASEMRELYSTVAERTAKFGKLFGHYLAKSICGDDLELVQLGFGKGALREESSLMR